MSVAGGYALGLALLGVWGGYAGWVTLRSGRRQSCRRAWIVLVDVLFSGVCFLCAAALAVGQFRREMAALLAVSYLAMLPMPCYFATVDRVRPLRLIRNLLFLAVAALCLAVATGLLPLARLGL